MLCSKEETLGAIFPLLQSSLSLALSKQTCMNHGGLLVKSKFNEISSDLRHIMFMFMMLAIHLPCIFLPLSNPSLKGWLRKKNGDIVETCNLRPIPCPNFCRFALGHPCDEEGQDDNLAPPPKLGPR